ncbi:hypothetical protein BDQ17DRAFT_1428425 [Cyathus striatus]|nr:hypothetical protein BDQ17DRAFT_1428425 [Cyathus striatus]
MASGNGLVAATAASSIYSTPVAIETVNAFLFPTASSFTNLPSASTSSLTAAQQSVTADALLKQHSSTADPPLAALEQAVNDRNVLSAQNAQLWKLIERQRVGYTQILKELERIRAERDGYKSKLASMTAGSSEKRHKTSERSSDRERSARPSLDTVSSQSGSSAADHTSFNPRQTMTRHLSDDAPTPRSSQHPPNLHSSRSYEPLSPQFHDTPPPSSANYPSSTNLKFDIPLAPPSSAPSHLHTPPSSSTSRTPRPSPSPLVVPPRSESLPTPTSAISTSSEASPYSRQVDISLNSNSSDSMYLNRGVMYSRKSSITDSVNSITTIGSSVSGSVSSMASSSINLQNYTIAHTPSTATSSSQSSLDPSSRQRTPTTATMPVPPQIVTSSPSTPSAPPASSPAQPQMLTTTVHESRQHLLSRDSRISLPDEAKHYIANMVDSPVPSPKVDAFTARARAHTNLTAPSPSSAGVISLREGEFLDMEEDDDDGGGDEDLADPAATTGSYEEDDLRGADHQPPYYTQDVPDQRSENEALDTSSIAPDASQTSSSGDDMSKRKGKIRAASEDIALLPISDSHQLEQSSSLLQEVQHDEQLQATAQAPAPSKYSHHDHSNTSAVATSHAGSAELAAPLDNPYSPSNQQGLEQPIEGLQRDQPMPAFRALPLLSSDMPYTTISVSHSFVRPNDRGKEVLSFIVTVNPGNGKDTWKVEKMYSDVLSLDQRVRSSVGKGVGKKIANLPEGKLWKDHAPAKVDQRKAVLEQYLQSLINLPVKNNDEVIAFFTSDIVRETKQPVMQAGHKEGYLTKRGKNFGGWKTRYFVLSGPVLEYYDASRGGAHLGSIVITGAQIGRQQKTERAPSTDEEKEYRHAFLIVEAKKGPGGNHPRHVLCAESDEDRDSWVEMLVRYFTGVYSEEPITYGSTGHSSPGAIAVAQQASAAAQPRASTSSNDALGSSRRPPIRGMSKDDISISKGAAVPLSQLPQDVNNAKLFQTTPLTVDSYARSSSPSKLDPSPVHRNDSSNSPLDVTSQTARRVLERGQGLPSSLPDSSPLSAVHPFQLEASSLGQRANSELGHYPDLRSGGRKLESPEKHRARDTDGRKSFHPNSNSSSSAAQPERVPSPEKLDANGKVKISRPLNGAPIPSGFKFGGKDISSEASTSDSRREKAKSRSFWGFGKEEALEVSQICNLPSIVFRCIQYLEAKKADQEEGIYRLSGSSAVIKSLKDRFNAEGDVDLLASDEYWDPHAIAGLLKSFLRELPASILTRELHLRFLAVIDFVDAQERIKELSQLIASLPIANYSLLRALTAHLILIVQNSGVNKMTMRNVGIVFSPTLGIPAGVFSLMLGEFNRVFNVETGEEVDEEKEDDGTSEPLRRNSRRYSEAAADQYLGLTGRSLSTPAEETPSEGDDFSVHDESGTETTDGDIAVETSSSASPIAGPGHQEGAGAVVVTPATPVAKSSRASHVAASRGLNVTVTHSERGNRHSKMIGLPSSPRPPHSPSRPSEGHDSLTSPRME